MAARAAADPAAELEEAGRPTAARQDGMKKGPVSRAFS